MVGSIASSSSVNEVPVCVSCGVMWCELCEVSVGPVSVVGSAVVPRGHG